MPDGGTTVGVPSSILSQEPCRLNRN